MASERPRRPARNRTPRPPARIRAWRPPVPGVAEVFHAHFTAHAYPPHTHDTWDLMILDDGSVDFALDRHRHGAAGTGSVILLPPGVAHDGRTVNATGFRKRVLYLDTTVLPEHLTGAAVDVPVHGDGLLRRRIHQLHTALGEAGAEGGDGGDVLEAESRLAFIRERLLGHLGHLGHPDHRGSAPAPRRPEARLAVRLRELLDASVRSGLPLAEAGALLGAHPTHLIRSFKQAYGVPPHAYMTGRRIDQARRLLLAGWRPAEVATEVGFHDQAHLHRHFVRYMGITPGRYAGNTGSPEAANRARSLRSGEPPWKGR